jgi:hypothetical protein
MMLGFGLCRTHLDLFRIRDHAHRFLFSEKLIELLYFVPVLLLPFLKSQKIRLQPARVSLGQTFLETHGPL